MAINSKQAKELQKRSMLSRISRNIAVLFQGTKPERKRDTDAGFDVFITSATIIKPKEFAMIPTGSKIRSPKGYFYYIVSRSSSILKGLVIPTAIIDSEYTGEIKVGAWNMTDHDIVLDEGERIAQVIFAPTINPTFSKVNKFPESTRGELGFGSSGK